MKKITTILMACALVMTMSQCKKEQVASPISDESVMITLNINGSNGSKAEVIPSTGQVLFNVGDIIYVASDGRYVGSLSYNGTQFLGSVSNAVTGLPLHFYYLGNASPSESFVSGETTSCTIDISNQSGNLVNGEWHLPVISYAPSVENYGETLSFTASLQNQCALVKFSVNTTSEDDIYVTGMNHIVDIDFSNASFTFSKYGVGSINLGSGSGEKWAILLPQEALEAGEMGTAYSEGYGYIGNLGAVPAISANSFLTLGINVIVVTQVGNSDAPLGALNGKFTVNANGKQVYFSQGNLQYIGSAVTPYWKFADNQWDYLATSTGQNSSNENVDRDLFGWGTSGYNHGAFYYQPWSTNTNNFYYYSYGESTFDLTDLSDWGYNAISNGGNQEHSGWRTLTVEEWQYLLFNRSGIRFAKAQLNGVNGIVILPDNWVLSYPQFVGYNNMQTPSSSNVFDVNTWLNLQANGAVFLPAAGNRLGSYFSDADSRGTYWSASHSSIYNSYHFSFYSNAVETRDGYRCTGRSVRLVQDCLAE